MVKPVRSMILVSKKEAEEKTASGLFMPGNVDEKMSTGEVVAVGSGHLTSGGAVVPLEVNVGDNVMFDNSTALQITVDGKKLFALREDQIYCIL